MRFRVRVLLTGTWVALLILLAGVTAVWVRSYWVADAWGWSSEKRAYQCGVALGRLRLDRTVLGEEGGSWRPSFAHTRYAAEADPPSHRLKASVRNLGFGFEHKVAGRNYESWLVMVPFWFIWLMLMGGCVMFWRLGKGALRRERRRAGLCVGCGYDLKGTPARCPECGRASGD
jgi:hypothetical protein